MNRNTKVAKCERGATMVEAAIAIPVFLAIVLVGVDLIRVVFLYVGVQFITTNAVREASTVTNVDNINGSVFSGSSLGDNVFLDIQGRERALDIVQSIRSSGGSYGVDLSNPASTTISICHESDAAFPRCDDLHAGFPNELFKVEVVHTVHSIFGGFQFPLRAEVIGKNEMQIPSDS